MDLAAWPLGTLVLAFAAASGGIWVAGTALARAADDLAEGFNLARSLVGLLLLAVATSLPEIATTLTGAARCASELVMGNLLGGVALQTAILAVADLWARSAISGYPRRHNHVLEASVLIGMLAVALVAIAMGEPVAFGHVGAGAVGAGLAYIAAIALLRRYDNAGDWVPVDLPEESDAAPLIPQVEPSLKALLVRISLSCVVILVLGLALIAISGPLASKSGLGTGFVGVTMLAAATSLPELTTTIAAVRIRAYGLAISNVFGSNLIMLGLILPADLLHGGGPILREAGPLAPLSIGFGILVTVIYLIGLTVRRKPSIRRLGVDSLAVLACYGLSLLAYWAAR